MYGFVHLLGGQAAATHRHMVAVQDVADRPAVDAELSTELVDGPAGLIGGDELLDLVGLELLRCGGYGWFRLLLERRGRIGQLLDQGFQLADLLLRVVVTSPQGPPGWSLCESAAVVGCRAG